MNKSKIEWCDYTWNPVTGCYHGCEYCYARAIVNRFTPKNRLCDTNCIHAPGCDDGEAVCSSYLKYQDVHKCSEESYYYNPKRFVPYPFGFEPTFHRYRLEEPSKKKKGVNIFVSSMGDLFGEWVPNQWIEEVFKSCELAQQHNYMFLTKNPKRYIEAIPQWKAYHNSLNNLWLGTSITRDCEKDIQRVWDLLTHTNKAVNKFVSIEPIHSEIDLHRYELLLEDYKNIITIGNYLDWVIVGAETGNRKGKVKPKREWIEKIVNQCKGVNVPIFLKDNLKPIWGEDLIQELPEELKHHGDKSNL